MPPKQTALQSHVRTLEYTTESNMEKGKPYLFTTENISLKELGAQGWKVPRGKQYSLEIGGAGSHHHPKAGETTEKMGKEVSKIKLTSLWWCSGKSACS